MGKQKKGKGGSGGGRGEGDVAPVTEDPRFASMHTAPVCAL